MQNRQRSKKKDITLMTLLAYEATPEARNMLKAHGKPDARNHEDLEQKLGQLYMSASDGEKAALEKELASIHPHKNWLFRTLKPEIQNLPEMPQAKETHSVTKTEIISNAEGNNTSGNKKYSCEGGCIGCRFSNAEGSSTNGMQQSQQHSNKTDYVPIIGLIAVIGLTFYFLKHNS